MHARNNYRDGNGRCKDVWIQEITADCSGHKHCPNSPMESEIVSNIFINRTM